MKLSNPFQSKLSPKEYEKWMNRSRRHLGVEGENKDLPPESPAATTAVINNSPESPAAPAAPTAVIDNSPESPAAPTAPPSSWLWDSNTDSPTMLAKGMWVFVMIWACLQVFVGLGLCMKAMQDSIPFHPVSHAIMNGTVTGIVLLVVRDIVIAALTTA